MYDFRDDHRAELCSIKEETYDLDEYSSRSSSSSNSNNILLDDLISEGYDDFSGVQSVPCELGYGVDWLSEFFSNDPVSDGGIPINIPISNMECTDVFPIPSFVPINARGNNLDSVSKFKQEEELFMDSSCYLARLNPINSTTMAHNGAFLAKSVIDNDNHIEDIAPNSAERRSINNELIHGNSADMFTNQSSNQQNVMLLAREAARTTMKLLEENPNLIENDLLGNDDNFDNDFDENMGICDVGGDLPSNPPLLPTYGDKISERCTNTLLKILPRRGVASFLHDSVLQGAIKIEEESNHEVDSGYESPASYSSFSPSFISSEIGNSCETLHYIDIPPQERIPFYLSEEEKKTLLTEGFTVPTGLPLSKIEEKALKKVRRKIKNKISAQESRRKKKEYLELLERRVENFANDNSRLKKKISGLEMNNRSLLLQVQKLQAMLNSKSGDRTANTSKASQTSGEVDLAGEISR